MRRPHPTSAKGRQAADYEAPIVTEPKGGPIPKWTGEDDEGQGDGSTKGR